MIRLLAVIGFVIGLLFIGVDFASGVNVPVMVVVGTALDLIVLSLPGRR